MLFRTLRLQIMHLLGSWHRRFAPSPHSKKDVADLFKSMKIPKSASGGILTMVKMKGKRCKEARHDYREAARSGDTVALARAKHTWFQLLLDLEESAAEFRAEAIDRNSKQTIGAQMKALDKVLDAETDGMFDFADRSPPSLFGRTWERLEVGVVQLLCSSWCPHTLLSFFLSITTSQVHARTRHSKDKKVWNLLLFLVIHFAVCRAPSLLSSSHLTWFGASVCPFACSGWAFTPSLLVCTWHWEVLVKVQPKLQDLRCSCWAGPLCCLRCLGSLQRLRTIAGW